MAVVVDETSMVSPTLMARLIEAVRPDARLILVSDPDQLASVEVGAVLGDIIAAGLPEPTLHTTLHQLGETAAVANGVVILDKTWRLGGDIAALANAVRDGDDDIAVAVLRAGGDQLQFVDSPARSASTSAPKSSRPCGRLPRLPNKATPQRRCAAWTRTGCCAPPASRGSNR